MIAFLKNVTPFHLLTETCHLCDLDISCRPTMSTGEALFQHGKEYGNPSGFRMVEQKSLFFPFLLKSGVIHLEEKKRKSKMRKQMFSVLAYLQTINLGTFRTSAFYGKPIPNLSYIPSLPKTSSSILLFCPVRLVSVGVALYQISRFSEGSTWYYLLMTKKNSSKVIVVRYFRWMCVFICVLENQSKESCNFFIETILACILC